jgi:1-acyl-sn-glycerol-3-phosphate acyltransferase
VRRGEADLEALETARTIEHGRARCVVPRGKPSRGARRAGVPSPRRRQDSARDGRADHPRGDHRHPAPLARRLPRLKRVQLAFLPEVAPENMEGLERVSELIDQRMWPAVRAGSGRLAGTPGLIAAGLAALGIGGGLLDNRRLEARRTPACSARSSRATRR